MNILTQKKQDDLSFNKITHKKAFLGISLNVKSVFNNFFNFEQKKQADAFLNSNMQKSYIEMVCHGYTPTHAQEEKFNDYFKAQWNNSTYDVISHLDQSILKGFKLSSYMSSIVLLNFHETLPLLLSDEFPSLTNALKEAVSHDKFTSQFISCLQTEIKSTNRADSFCSLQEKILSVLMHNHQNDILKNVTLPDLHSIIKVSDRQIRRIDEDLEERIIRADFVKKSIHINNVVLPHVIETQFTQKIKEQIQKTHDIYKDTLETNALYQAHKSINNAENVLTKTIKEKITHIEKIYSTIKNSIDETTQADNLFEKRVPAVIEKYFRVPAEYRDTMKHQVTGQTAHDILIESLNNYEIKLQSILDEKLQNQLSDMNVDRTYSRKI